MYPGQDKESGVIGNKMEVLFSYIRRPADKFIPAANMAGDRTESKAGNRSLAKEDKVFEMFSNRLSIAQVMIVLNEAVEEFFFGCASNLHKLKWLNLG